MARAARLYVDDEVVAEAEIRTMIGHFSLCSEGLCIGCDGGDAVSSEYTPTFEFERHLAAAMARD